MADTIILDTNVLKHISRGSQPVADALNRYLKSGAQVYISRAAYKELVDGAPTPQMGGQYREMLADLRINVAASGAMADRVNFLADNMQREPAPNTPGQIKEYGSKGDPPRPGDAFVAAQAKAINAKLWTIDTKFAKRANVMGVQTVPECALAGASGPEVPDNARRMLGLNPKPVGANGQALPPVKPGGGGSAGTYSLQGVADKTVPAPPPPSPKGTAIIGGIQLAFQGINFVLNLINDRIQKEKVEAELEKIRPAVAGARAANPRLGVLILFYYHQFQAPSESLIQPGATFHYLIWGKGVTADEARRDALSAPAISQGTGPNERRFSQEVWIPPLQKTGITEAKCPFPPVALGRLVLDGSNKAKFQLVEFSVFGGFDDIVEKSLGIPGGRDVDFAVLDAPHEVYWYNINGRQKTDVPLKESRTANGNTIKVVDLDPWSPFHAKAAMVFPYDAWCEEVFKAVEPTRNAQPLSTYVNFGMVRWVRPENIHLLRFVG